MNKKIKKETIKKKKEASKEKEEKKVRKVLFYPITTEKAVRFIEIENKITFVVDRRARKKEIKEEIEKKFKVKVDKINLHINKNNKIAYIRLKKETPAIEIATKLGMI